jgi:hypothetical protein
VLRPEWANDYISTQGVYAITQPKVDCDLMEELVSQLPKDVDHDRTLPGGFLADTRAEAHATTGADFRALRTMLDELDPDEGWGGLSQYQAPGLPA